VSRDELLNDVWDWKADGDGNVVDALVPGIRKKPGRQAGIIQTARGVGYPYPSGLERRTRWTLAQLRRTVAPT
jgi:DNA-binding response OmpR family regulator